MFAYPPAPPAINSFGGEVNNVAAVRPTETLMQCVQKGIETLAAS